MCICLLCFLFHFSLLCRMFVYETPNDNEDVGGSGPAETRQLEELLLQERQVP